MQRLHGRQNLLHALAEQMIRVGSRRHWMAVRFAEQCACLSDVLVRAIQILVWVDGPKVFVPERVQAGQSVLRPLVRQSHLVFRTADETAAAPTMARGSREQRLKIAFDRLDLDAESKQALFPPLR